MNERTNNITWIFLALVISGLVAGVAYYFLFGRATTIPVATVQQPYGTLFPQSGDTSKPSATNQQTPGGQASGTTNINEGNTATNGSIVDQSAATLKHITTVAISGSIMLGKATSTTFRYVEKATGHVAEIGFLGTLPKTITNTTITKNQVTFWNNTGTTALVRLFTNESNALQNMLASVILATSSTGSTITGEFKGGILPSSIKEVAVSPDKQSIFYLNAAGSGVIGITADFKNKNQKQVFDAMLTEWNVDWPSANVLALTTKPSTLAQGALYLVNPQKGTGAFALKNIRGLTAIVSPTGKHIVYSQSTNSGFATYIFDTTTKEITQFPITALPEKCVWSSKDESVIYCAAAETIIPASYPDDWYMGFLQFNDTLWKVSITEGSATILARPLFDVGAALDMTNLQLNSDESMLSFVNKQDSTLWAANLSAK